MDIYEPGESSFNDKHLIGQNFVLFFFDFI